MINIEKWIHTYQDLMLQTFGNRVLYIGLQGSYARKEAHEDSNIDLS